MSHIDDSLIEGELVIHRARMTWWSQTGLIVLGLILSVVVLGLAFLAWAWINVRSTEVGITNRRIIHKSGWIRRTFVEISLDRVESLQVDQGFIGRMLNFGDIQITGVGERLPVIENLADPLVFRRKFMEATNRPMTMPRQ